MENNRIVDSDTPQPAVALGAIAALTLVGVAVVTSRRGIGIGPHSRTDKRRSAFAAYLRDHLAGADAAIQVMESLASSGGARQQSLFTGLADELRQDREVVTALLARLGRSSLSIKRLGGRTAGVILRTARGAGADLALFRALEGLSVGIQGKRCLWRAGQTLEPGLRAPGRLSFAELEARAIRQWDAVEEYRRSLARSTFAP